LLATSSAIEKGWTYNSQILHKEINTQERPFPDIGNLLDGVSLKRRGDKPCFVACVEAIDEFEES
jgi:hypothetical protein